MFSLVELERPAAHHADVAFPPHSFRPGDIASISESSKKAATKGKAKANEETAASSQIEGVIYRVSDTRIVLAVKQQSDNDTLEVPERVKL